MVAKFSKTYGVMVQKVKRDSDDKSKCSILTNLALVHTCNTEQCSFQSHLTTIPDINTGKKPSTWGFSYVYNSFAFSTILLKTTVKNLKCVKFPVLNALPRCKL